MNPTKAERWQDKLEIFMSKHGYANIEIKCGKVDIEALFDEDDFIEMCHLVSNANK